MTLSTTYSSSTFSDPWVRETRNNDSVKSTKIDSDRFFEENEEDTPAAYRCNLVGTDINEKCTKKVRHNHISSRSEKVSSSSNSSFGSSSSFSSSSSHSSSHQVENHKNHDLNEKNINANNNNIDKKQKRENLLQKLKSVEKAIAKKRKKFGV